MKRGRRPICLFLTLIICMTCFMLSVFAEENEEINIGLNARSAVLMDGGTGRILYATENQDVMAMASTTKIMTCILALENGNLDSLVEISSYAASQPDVQLNARKGETYRLEDLLYSLMLESHNDSAVAIAEHIGGTVEGFAAMMNQKARDIGCYDSYFITPNGLDKEDADGSGRFHSTTASDLARIMRYCIVDSPKKEAFLEITRTQSRTFSDSSGSHVASCSNHNAFLSMMDGALTGKTGFTGKAGYCYIGALQRGEKLFIVALLGSGWPPHKTYKWADTKKLMNFALEHYEYRQLDERPDETHLQPVEVLNGQSGRIGEKALAELLVQTESFGMLMMPSEEVKLVYHVPDSLKAPVSPGMIVGSIEYQVGGRTWKTDRILVKNQVEKIDYVWCLEEVLKKCGFFWRWSA